MPNDGRQIVIDTSAGAKVVMLPVALADVPSLRAADSVAVEGADKYHFIPADATDVTLPLAPADPDAPPPVITVLRRANAGLLVEPVGVTLHDHEWAEFRARVVALDEDGQNLKQPYFIWWEHATNRPLEDGSTEAAQTRLR